MLPFIILLVISLLVLFLTNWDILSIYIWVKYNFHSSDDIG
jgi:hypothetical protein